jgi:hypothetical protein
MEETFNEQLISVLDGIKTNLGRIATELFNMRSNADGENN